jgi:NAD(P)-dependent dehydrogenase (short-subunit alcohol dehydrogenase family)
VDFRDLPSSALEGLPSSFVSNDRQHPIGTGFGASTTAQEVLAGVDLTGATVLVTGGYSGIGLETTRALSGAGAHVVVPARRPAQAKEALDGIEHIEVDELDLGDLASVEAFAGRFLASDRPLRAVIDSAGIMANPETRVGPGWESQFATNHLGHFALVNRLWPAIAAGRGRVVAVSSRGHQTSPIRWDDVQFATGYDKWLAYGQAKTANVLFAVHLDALGRGAGVRAFALHPGGILTPLQRHTPIEEQIERGWRLADGTPNPAFRMKSPEQGAATQTWAATSPQLDGLGGLYLEDCEVAAVVEGERSGLGTGVMPYAIDPEQAARLWALSAELTGVDAFA